MVKYKSGFSLIELLAVMMIIAVISSIIIAVGGSALTRAKKGKAEALIAAMEIAANMYRSDLGNWPRRDRIVDDDNDRAATASECLYFYLGTQLTISGEKYGPYISFKERDLADPDKDGDSDPEVIDPWDKLYGYYADTDNDPLTTPPHHNKSGVDIFSKGPDKKTGTVGTVNEGNEYPPHPPDGDDINNWR